MSERMLEQNRLADLLEDTAKMLRENKANESLSLQDIGRDIEYLYKTIFQHTHYAEYRPLGL